MTDSHGVLPQFKYFKDTDATDTATTTATIEAEWMISDGDVTWSQVEPNFIIPFDINCTDGQYLTIENREMVCVDSPTRQYIIHEEAIMSWTIGNIAIVVVICIVVYKMMPRLTLLNLFKALWKMVIRPFQRKEKDISDKWNKAERETRD